MSPCCISAQKFTNPSMSNLKLLMGRDRQTNCAFVGTFRPQSKLRKYVIFNYLETDSSPLSINCYTRYAQATTYRNWASHGNFL
jgi:hypothetical protein